MIKRGGDKAYPYALYCVLGLILYAVVLPFLLQSLSSGIIYSEFLRGLFFLLLTLTAGILTGSVFPVTTYNYLEVDPNNLKAAAYMESFDHLGAGLGAFLTGIFFVPVLGIVNTCFFIGLAGFAGLCFYLAPALKRTK